MHGSTPHNAFISYHHIDQEWKNYFVQEFAVNQEIFIDGSLDDRVDSNAPEYVHRRIREEYITGTSVTIVLCGAETWKRRYIDWEIHSTIHKRHGIFGIVIPGTPASGVNNYRVPDRLEDNIPGYATLYTWPGSGLELRMWIEQSITRAKLHEPDNSRAQMSYNHT
jgi:hypothetical protein